jgi:hypothetical protein
MPECFGTSGKWPNVAKTTPGLIGGPVTKNLPSYVVPMAQTIANHFKTMQDPHQGMRSQVSCLLLILPLDYQVSVFDLASSLAARSGSLLMVGSETCDNEEFLTAAKTHVTGMIFVTRALFLVPEFIKNYFGTYLSKLVTVGTPWDMYAARKVLIKHFDACADRCTKEKELEESSSQVKASSSFGENLTYLA